VVIALKLKEVFGLDDTNQLPISYNIAWYEQKAVIVLLALLYLGVKDIHLGSTLPGFLSPNVVTVLVNTFGIAGITTAQDDVAIFMASQPGHAGSPGRQGCGSTLGQVAGLGASGVAGPASPDQQDGPR